MSREEKIQNIAVAYILKNVLHRLDWECTVIGRLHPEVEQRVVLQDAELPVASAFFSGESWYVFTTRRVISMFRGERREIVAEPGIHWDFGDLKTKGTPARGIASLRAPSGETLQFEFVTWEESTIPTTALRYWDVKHPVLDKLLTTGEFAEE